MFFLSNYVGTPTLTRALPVIKRYADAILVGNFTGAQPQREAPYVEHVFNIRASYRQEMMALVERFWGAGRPQVRRLLPDRRLRPQRHRRRGARAGAARGQDRGRGDLLRGRQVRGGHDARGGGAAPGGLRRRAVHGRLPGLRRLRPDRARSRLDRADLERLLRRLRRDAGPPAQAGQDDRPRLHARPRQLPGGAELRRRSACPAWSSTAPSWTSTTRPCPRRCATRGYAPQRYSFISLEGFVNAKVIVEALRRAGTNPTRASLRQALESHAERRSRHRRAAHLRPRAPPGSGQRLLHPGRGRALGARHRLDRGRSRLSRGEPHGTTSEATGRGAADRHNRRGPGSWPPRQDRPLPRGGAGAAGRRDVVRLRAIAQDEHDRGVHVQGHGHRHEPRLLRRGPHLHPRRVHRAGARGPVRRHQRRGLRHGVRPAEDAHRPHLLAARCPPGIVDKNIVPGDVAAAGAGHRVPGPGAGRATREIIDIGGAHGSPASSARCASAWTGPSSTRPRPPRAVQLLLVFGGVAALAAASAASSSPAASRDRSRSSWRRPSGSARATSARPSRSRRATRSAQLAQTFNDSIVRLPLAGPDGDRARRRAAAARGAAGQHHRVPRHGHGGLAGGPHQARRGDLRRARQRGGRHQRHGRRDRRPSSPTCARPRITCRRARAR